MTESEFVGFARLRVGNVYSVRVADEQDLVELAINARVPRSFTTTEQSIVNWNNRPPEPTVVGQAVVRMVIVDGEPLFQGLTLTFDPPVSDAQLAGVDWSDLKYHSVIRAQRPAIHDSATARRAIQVARDVTYRTNRRLTPEFLRDVAQWWNEGGPQRVAEQANVGRRQADRYVNRAREEGLL